MKIFLTICLFSLSPWIASPVWSRGDNARFLVVTGVNGADQLVRRFSGIQSEIDCEMALTQVQGDIQANMAADGTVFFGEIEIDPNSARCTGGAP